MSKLTERVPQAKKFEMTSKDTFVVHAEGGNRFEGKITKPGVTYNGKASVMSGVCFGNCANRNKKCDECYRKSCYLEDVSGGS